MHVINLARSPQIQIENNCYPAASFMKPLRKFVMLRRLS